MSIAPEWSVVFFGLIGLSIVLGCAYLVIRKLFGKKRHGDKNKVKPMDFKGFFKGAAVVKDLGSIGNNKACFVFCHFYLQSFQIQSDQIKLSEHMEQNEKEQAGTKEEVSSKHKLNRLGINNIQKAK